MRSGPPDSEASAFEQRFPPGSVFAGRYRMITLIGRGAMGEVWHAEDLTLETPVALKVIHATDEEGHERILKEVRLARQITHPAVCRVFDVGASDGHIFYSMELVDGEDLATLLRRIGRLPPEKAIDIGVQLCGGLAAAHAAGVLHRDLKPANVLIDADGSVRITDFGIAITRSEPGYDMVAGTPGYMAPEQLAGLPLSERTDIYALGVVLYQLLVGTLPYPDGIHTGTRPARPSVIVKDVSPLVDRALARALALDPRDRPASAAELASRLRPDLIAEAGRGRVWRWVGAAAAVAIVAALIALAARTRPVPVRALTDRDTIVLADFVNTTGDSVFDGALQVALAVALEQSPFLKVFPDERVRETLQLIQRSPEQDVTRPVAREIARRAQLKALVAGSIDSFGRHYVLTLEAISAESGDSMAREQVEVGTKEEVLASLGSAASKLRERLGESLASIKRFDVELPRATTKSLDALHAYALALDQGRLTPRREAIPHLRRALELDPGFAMAQALYSAVLANSGETAAAPQYSRAAFELRDRVSERERFFISWRYYMDAAQAWDQALDLAQSWTATYPREAFAFNSLGLASAAFGDHDEAVRAFRRAIEIDPQFLPPYGNLAGSLTALNRFDEATAILAEARRLRIEGTALRRAAYVLPFIANDAAGMSSALSAARAAGSVAGASIWEARAAGFDGRFSMAHSLFERGVQSALEQKLPEVAAQWTAEDAELYALAERCSDAMRRTEDALRLSRDNFTLERSSRTAALCDAGETVSRLSAELTTRYPDAVLTNRVQRPVAAAALAWRRRNPARVMELLDPVRSFDHAPSTEFWSMYLRGSAALQLDDAAHARAEFQGILDNRGEAPTSPLYALAHLGAARAAARAGDTGGARAAYQAFLAGWKDADPDLVPLRDARAEYARLQ